MVIDRHKIRRQRTTLQQGGTFKIEEDITLIEKPKTAHLGHLTIEHGNSKTIAIFFIEDETLDLSKLQAIGCDGCAVNTGRNGVFVHLLENHLSKPVNWIVCLFTH